MPDSSPTLTVRHRALREQLARWQAAGLLSAEQAAAIWNHEQQREGHTPSRPPWAVTVSVIGALVLGLGLIALVAANWDGLSRTVRLVGLIALMLGSYAVGYRLRDRPAGRWPGTGAAFYLLGGVLFGGLLAFLACACSWTYRSPPCCCYGGRIGSAGLRRAAARRAAPGPAAGRRHSAAGAVQ
ncbi:DUF2157 domain-containing protein [Deinococcus radiophilus]|uniref:DUF2157 domain-containing protein n=1 Tax=Deinococcus radiophilus TaxID=32062 RepID=UPI003610D907